MLGTNKVVVVVVVLLDRDLMTMKKALNNKIPVGEENDWQLPLIIEEFARRKIQPLQLAPAVAPGSETPTHDVSKSTSSRRLDFLLWHREPSHLVRI